MTLRQQLTMAALVLLAPLAHPQNNGIPGPDQSVVMLETVASKGLECGLIEAWQAAGLQAMVEMDTRSWTAERRSMVAAAAAERIAGTDCDDSFVTTYLAAAGPNMETESLAPYLVGYRTLAAMDPQPVVFRATALRLDHAAIIDAIDAKLEALAASGRPPEGGKPWPEFIETTQIRVQAMVDSYRSGETSGRYSPDEAAALIAQAGLITRLWYDSEMRTEEPAEQ